MHVGRKTQGKRRFWLPEHRWKYNIKMDLKETGWEGIEGIDLAQDRDRWWAVVNMVMNFQVTQNAGNFLTS